MKAHVTTALTVTALLAAFAATAAFIAATTPLRPGDLLLIVLAAPLLLAVFVLLFDVRD